MAHLIRWVPGELAAEAARTRMAFAAEDPVAQMELEAQLVNIKVSVTFSLLFIS